MPRPWLLTLATAARCGAGLLLVAFLGTTGATTYYFDRTSGSDSAACTSETAPCQTLSKLNSLSLQPGDVVRLKRGSVWAGSGDLDRLVFRSGRSGVPGQPLTITTYGTGARARLESPAVGPGVRCEESDWLVIEGVEFAGYFTGMTFDGCQGIVVQDVVIRETVQTGISWQKSPSGRISTGGLFRGNQLLSLGSNGYGEGFYIGTSDSADLSGHVIIRDNIVVGNSHECLDLKNTGGGGAQHVLFSHNTCLMNATHNEDSQRQQTESYCSNNCTDGQHVIRANYLAAHRGQAHGVRWRGQGGRIERNIIAQVPARGADFTAPLFPVVFTRNTIWASGSDCWKDVTGQVSATANLCQDNQAGNTCSGACNTLRDPAGGDFSLPEASTCRGTGALEPFALTAAVIEATGRTLLLTFGSLPADGPLQCPQSAADVTLAGCVGTIPQVATGCTAVGLQQLRLEVAAAVRVGETGCTVSLPARTVRDSLRLGGVFASQIAALSGGAHPNLVTQDSANSAVTAFPVDNQSTGAPCAADP